MNILLFNDTDGNYHFGCSATSQAVKWYLKIPQGTYTHTVVDSWCMLPVAYEEADFDDDIFFEKWKDINGDLYKKMMAADLCVFNGEGTLHGYEKRAGARNLLYLMYIAKKRLGKKVFALNQSCFPVYNIQDVGDTLACNIYKKVLSVIDFCSVRETRSLGILNRLGLHAVLAFDCLPLYIHTLFRETELPKNVKKEYTLLGGGSTLYLTFGKFVKKMWRDFKPIGKVYFLVCDMPEVNWDDQQCIKAIKKYNKRLKTKMLRRRIKVLHVHSTDEWLSVIKNASLLISGRFHHSVAAAVFNIPYYCLEANTQKTEALELITRPEELWRLSLENFK